MIEKLFLILLKPANFDNKIYSKMLMTLLNSFNYNCT